MLSCVKASRSQAAQSRANFSRDSRAIHRVSMRSISSAFLVDLVTAMTLLQVASWLRSFVSPSIQHSRTQSSVVARSWHRATDSKSLRKRDCFLVLKLEPSGLQSQRFRRSRLRLTRPVDSTTSGLAWKFPWKRSACGRAISNSPAQQD